MKKVIVIVGPTGIGKSNLGILVAKKFNLEIISGDSVQVYRELNIGSAKVIDTQGIKHHLINILSIDDEYSVSDFQKEVRNKINEIDNPIIVGGTGLYVKAALYNYEFNHLKRNPNFEKTMMNKSNDEIYNDLIKIDSSCNVDKNNRIRLLRAYEMALIGDLPSLKNKKNEPLYNVLMICLTMEREQLYQRINNRVDQMIKDGLILEAKNLFDRGYRLKVIGYQELNDYFLNNISLDEAINEIKKNTRNYAKRQITWFKNQMNAIMIDINDDYIFEATKLIGDFLCK